MLPSSSTLVQAKKIKIVMTGGHHSSALPVIEELKRDASLNCEIYWLGHKFSLKGDTNSTLEYKEITNLGIPFYELHAGKIYKTYNIQRLVKVPFGVFHSLYLLLKIQPDVILSFGGYLAAPVVFAGWLLGIKSITHEQTVVAGYANKFISHFVKKILISWPNSKKYFPADKVILSGLPLRKEIFKINSANFNFENSLPTVYITCGKTGSHIINQVVRASLETLLDKCNIIHQTGDYSLENDFESLSTKYEKLKNSKAGKYYPRKFVHADEIGEVFSKADVVVGRAGSHIISEILALKKLALLIPIPWVSHNEQFENAKIVESYGLGTILEEKNLSAENFQLKLFEVLTKIGSIKITKDLDSLFKQDSAKIIAHEVLSTAHRN